MKQLIAFGSLYLGIFIAGSWNIRKYNLKQHIRDMNQKQLSLYIFNIVMLIISFAFMINGLVINHKFTVKYRENGVYMQGEITYCGPGDFHGKYTTLVDYTYKLKIVYNGEEKEVSSWSDVRYYVHDTVGVYYIPDNSYVMFEEDKNCHEGEVMIEHSLFLFVAVIAIWIWRYDGAILD